MFCENEIRKSVILNPDSEHLKSKRHEFGILATTSWHSQVKRVIASNIPFDVFLKMPLKSRIKSVQWRMGMSTNSLTRLRMYMQITIVHLRK